MSIQEVEVTIAVTHGWIGDLVIKIFSPGNAEVTLMSRPGMDEQDDDGDDCDPCGSNPEYGDGSNLDAAFPIHFADAAPNDAEDMGMGLSDSEVVCEADALCDYAPNPDAGPGVALSDFAGTDPNGTWLVCVADGSPQSSGDLGPVTLSVLAY
jgi:hypothetical protein